MQLLAPGMGKIRFKAAKPAQPGGHAISDEELWHDFQQGNDAAYTAIYNKYANRVYAYLKLLVSTAERAQLDDLFQDTWIKIYEQRNRFNIMENATLAGWIFRLAHNTTISAFRKSRHESSLDDDELSMEVMQAITVDPSNVYSDELSVEAQMALVMEALEKLPPILREVFVLFEINKLSFDSISEMLSISRTNVKVRLFRARKSLREMLGPIISGSDEDI